MQRIGELLALSNAVLFAFSNIFNKRALDQMDKNSGMIITLIVNNILNALGVLVIYLTGYWPPVNLTGVFWFILSGVFTSYFGRDLLFRSVSINGPSKASTYKVTSPIFTLLIGMFIMNEQVNGGSMIGALICLLGIGIISFANTPINSTTLVKGKKIAGLGVLIGLGSGLSFALGMTTRKLGVQVWPSSLAGALLGSMTAYALTLLSYTINRKTIPWRQMLSKKSVNYIYSGICTGLAILSLFIALKYVTVTITNVISSLEPLFTILLTAIMLRSKGQISIKLVVGALLVALGVILIFIY